MRIRCQEFLRGFEEESVIMKGVGFCKTNSSVFFEGSSQADSVRHRFLIVLSKWGLA